MLAYIDSPENKSVELIINGKITGEDYEDLSRHLRERIDEWGRLNLIENIQSFEGFEMKAFWQNLKFGKDHLKDIPKCAVVTDRKWIRKISDLSDPFLDMEIRAFSRDEIDEARRWASDFDFTEFFADYGEAALRPDKIAAFYGDFALASTPAFVGVLKGREEVRSALERIAERQRASGLQSMIPLETKSTALDERHFLVKVKWQAIFDKNGPQAADFENTYLVRREEGETKILFYVAHQDEEIMRRKMDLQ